MKTEIRGHGLNGLSLLGRLAMPLQPYKDHTMNERTTILHTTNTYGHPAMIIA